VDHAFSDLTGKIMEYYQDDLSIYSKLQEFHSKHLNQVFQRYKMYGISINPKKCLFVVLEGKLLCHIVRKQCIYIDAERIKEIHKINPPIYLKGVQYFFRNIIFVRRLVPYYATIINQINNLLKNDNKFE